MMLYDALCLWNSNDKLAINTKLSIPGKVMQSLCSQRLMTSSSVSTRPKPDFKDPGSTSDYRIFMDLYMDFYGFIYMDLYGSIWIYIDLCGSIWIYMDLCGSMWIYGGQKSVRIRSESFRKPGPLASCRTNPRLLWTLDEGCKHWEICRNMFWEVY